METSPENEPDTERPEEYPKADVMNRFIAKFIDFLIVGALAQMIHPVGFFAGMTYLLIADGLFEGQSLGKRLISLQTLQIETGTTTSFRESILRNIPFALGFLFLALPFLGLLLAGGVVAVEALLVIGNPKGLRVGDEMARTQVVDGKPVTRSDSAERPMNV